MWPWKLQLTFIIWRPYLTSWSKRSLSRCGLLDHILCKWQLVDIILSECGLFWVRGGKWGFILGGWGCMGYYFGWVKVSGRWVGHYFGWVGVVGKIFWRVWVGALFDNALLERSKNRAQRVVLTSLRSQAIGKKCWSQFLIETEGKCCAWRVNIW